MAAHTAVSIETQHKPLKPLSVSNHEYLDDIATKERKKDMKTKHKFWALEIHVQNLPLYLSH